MLFPALADKYGVSHLNHDHIRFIVNPSRSQLGWVKTSKSCRNLGHALLQLSIFFPVIQEFQEHYAICEVEVEWGTIGKGSLFNFQTVNLNVFQVSQTTNYFADNIQCTLVPCPNQFSLCTLAKRETFLCMHEEVWKFGRFCNFNSQ